MFSNRDFDHMATDVAGENQNCEPSGRPCTKNNEPILYLGIYEILLQISKTKRDIPRSVS